MANRAVKAAILSTAMAALAAVPAASVLTLAGTGAALAKNGNGGGNGGGNGNGGGGGNGNGRSQEARSNGGGNGTSGGGRPEWAGGGQRGTVERGGGNPLRRLFGGGQNRAQPQGNGNRGAVAVTRGNTSNTLRNATAPAVSPMPAPRNQHGKLSSELKGLNAAHASLNAFVNASPDSQVGRIATYREAYLEYLDTEAELTDLEDTLTELRESYDGPITSDLLADASGLDPDDPAIAEALDTLAGLDPEAADYDDQINDVLSDLTALEGEDLETLRSDLETARAQEDAVTELEEEIADLEEELEELDETQSDAFLEASGGRELSPEAMDYFHDLVRLGEPLPGAEEETAEADVETEVDPMILQAQ